MAKTPSHNVIAAKWILAQLEADGQAPTLTPAALTDLAESRVNDAKAEKVRDQIGKIVGKTITRCQKIVDKFEGNTSSKPSKKAPPPKKKARKDEEE